MKKYLSIMSNHTKLKCIGVIALAFVSSLLASVWPVKLGDLYTNISSGAIRTVAQGSAALLTFGIIYLASECITIARRVLLEYIVASHESEIRELSVSKMLKMPMAYYQEGLSGERTARLNQGVSGLSQLIKIMCNDVFATLLTAVCTLVQVFLRAPGIMVGFMLLYLFISVAISIFQIRSQNGIRESIVNKKNTLDGQICQSISNIELIRGMNAENYETNRLHPSIRNICLAEKRHHRYMGKFDCMKQCCKIAFQIGLIVVSLLMVERGKMDAGTVIAVCLLFQQLVKPIDDVYRFMDDTAASAIKSKALLEVVSCESDELFDIPDSNAPLQSDTLHLDDVVITNPGKTQALAWYEKLTIPCGNIVGLVGPSGSGKTTLVRALKGLAPFTRGEISLFGRPLNSYSAKELASLLYYVPQSTFFFAGSLRENLTYGLDRPCAEDEMMSALQRVYLVGSREGSLGQTAEVLDRPISEGAANLSGGQRQRLSLARAYLRQPKMFIFDESTANLDENTVAAVLDNMERYAKSIGAGILYISHDKNVTNRCDIVLPIDNRLKLDNKLRIIA